MVDRDHGDVLSELAEPRRVPSREVLAVLIAALKDADEDCRRAGAMGLEAQGEASAPAAGALVASLGHKGRHLPAVLEALAKIGRSAVPALIDGLGSEDKAVREAIISVLDNDQRAQMAVEALLTVLNRDPQPALRLRAAFAIARTSQRAAAVPYSCGRSGTPTQTFDTMRTGWCCSASRHSALNADLRDVIVVHSLSFTRRRHHARPSNAGARPRAASHRPRALSIDRA